MLRRYLITSLQPFVFYGCATHVSAVVCFRLIAHSKSNVSTAGNTGPIPIDRRISVVADDLVAVIPLVT